MNNDSFLYFILIKPFKDGWPGWIMGIIFWSIFLALLWLVGFGIYHFGFDRPGPLQSESAIVTASKYHEPYTTTTMIMAGKVMVPRIIHHSESWEVRGKTDSGLSFEASFDKETGYGTKDRVKVVYAIRRLSGSLEVESLQLIKKRKSS